MPLDLQELSDNTINKIISPNNIIISNRFILSITITLIILLIFYMYAKDDVDTIYADSNMYEISMKSTVVSSFVVYGLIYFNNKLIEKKIKDKYDTKESKNILDDITRQTNNVNSINSIKPDLAESKKEI